ncbi:nucleotidyltransferase family protein, partial [bacterium]
MGRPVKGFILAAGLGTRLRPLSDRVAKPSMEFFGVPMAAHTLNSLAGAGV